LVAEGFGLRFSRLRLNGFKSFVDPTELVIADGLTGVVGPNGCGKSNLLEALRWVMGENRASAMRGDGMEDVIFAGASTRPARHFAEVSLTIDNEDRLAPAGFNEADALDITRRITREAGSAYKVNQKDVRARDVQMLFADASTGAHSPALVRQGQISELINARPKARRVILEEAAGISGLYQRRHEAELKLNGAEANLLRIDDVINALAEQLATLAKQARQAARYREIGEELRRAEGMLLYRRWREAEDQRLKADLGLRLRLSEAGQAERHARDTMKAREAAEAQLPPLREEEAIAAAVLQRLLVQRDALAAEDAQAEAAIATLTDRIAELAKDREREEALNRDAGETIAKLEWEARELTKAADGQDDKLALAQEAARAAAADLERIEAGLNALTEDLARLSARHQSAERLRDDMARAKARSEGEAEKAGAAVADARNALSANEQVKAEAETRQAASIKVQAEAEAALAAADVARSEAQALEAEARARRSETEGELAALKAEAAALARLLDRDTAEGGQVMDLLSVKPGYEVALGAALADDLKAPVLQGALRSGWQDLTPYDRPQPLPEGVTALADFVSVPGVLARRLSQVGLIGAEDGARVQGELKPGQRLVSLEGDLWRWDGYTVAAADAPSSAALRLQQLNRLEALKQDSAAASARAQGAAQAHDVLKTRLSEATSADAAAREQRRRAEQAAADAARAMSRAEAEANIAAGRLENLTLTLERHRDEAATSAQGLAEAEAAFAALPDLGAARAAIEDRKSEVETARAEMLARRSAQDEIRREGEARTRRRQEVARDLSGWKHRLETAGKRIAELTDRQAASEVELKAASALPAEIAAKRSALAVALGDAEKRKARAADALSSGESALREATHHERDAERLAGEAREARARAEGQVEAAAQLVSQAAERIREEVDATPAELLTQIAVDPDTIPTLDALEIDIARLKRNREALGAVNLRAEEDAAEVQSEHDTLVAEKSDLEEAIRKLRVGISSLNREGRERLITAFEQVNRNFTQLFTHLFGGGEAKLVMVESEDPLEAGLEIMCQPPGKKLSTLSLLSGGEQTLTALSLIFAVFQTNPAPICVLDEVDAPLDDANVTRFCDLLDEMARQTNTRFLVITHHAVTMSRMDRLFGVTMGEPGVSQLVSVDLKKAEALVA
jgi:chromosome segregation protein